MISRSCPIPLLPQALHERAYRITFREVAEEILCHPLRASDQAVEHRACDRRSHPCPQIDYGVSSEHYG